MPELKGTTRLHGVTPQRMPMLIITAERTSHIRMYLIMVINFNDIILIEMDVKE
jgi:hypothetical protein